LGDNQYVAINVMTLRAAHVLRIAEINGVDYA
jgi:hypothetical protein